MKILRAASFAALLAFGSLAAAQDIMLTSPDGAVEISGNLLGFDGEFYRVETQYGELTVDGSGVNCDGPGCPNLTDFVAEITIAGAAGMAEMLMPALLDGFALRNGYAVAREIQDTRNFTYVLSDPQTQSALARFTFRASTTDEGFADLLANEADIAMSLREIRKAEVRRGFEAGLGNMRGKNRSRVLALNALVPIVAPGHPVIAFQLQIWRGFSQARSTIGRRLAGQMHQLHCMCRNGNRAFCKPSKIGFCDQPGRASAQTQSITAKWRT